MNPAGHRLRRDVGAPVEPVTPAGADRPYRGDELRGITDEVSLPWNIDEQFAKRLHHRPDDEPPDCIEEDYGWPDLGNQVPGPDEISGTDDAPDRDQVCHPRPDPAPEPELSLGGKRIAGAFVRCPALFDLQLPLIGIGKGKQGSVAVFFRSQGGVVLVQTALPRSLCMIPTVDHE